MPQPAKSKKPTRKVRAGLFAGTITAGAVTALFAAAHIGVTKGVAVAIATVLTVGLHFAASYLTKSGA